MHVVCLSSASQPGQVEELGLFGRRRSSVRRSARNAHVKGPIDPKGKSVRAGVPGRYRYGFEVSVLGWLVEY